MEESESGNYLSKVQIEDYINDSCCEVSKVFSELANTRLHVYDAIEELIHQKPNRVNFNPAAKVNRVRILAKRIMSICDIIEVEQSKLKAYKATIRK